jgi:hypothetical protein
MKYLEIRDNMGEGNTSDENNYIGRRYIEIHEAENDMVLFKRLFANFYETWLDDMKGDKGESYCIPFEEWLLTECEPSNVLDDSSFTQIWKLEDIPKCIFGWRINLNYGKEPIEIVVSKNIIGDLDYPTVIK